jgi:hypothetical protein
MNVALNKRLLLVCRRQRTSSEIVAAPLELLYSEVWTAHWPEMQVEISYLHVKWSGQIISLDGSRICVLGTPLEYSSTCSQCWYYVVEITALVQKQDAIISIKTCGCHFLQNSMFIFGLPNSRPTNGKAIHKNLPFFEEAINAWKVNFGILGGYSTPRLVF